MKKQLTWLSIAFTLSTSVPALAQAQEHYATPVNPNTGIVPPDRRGNENHREREERERRERREREEQARRERAQHERWEREHNPNVHGASAVNR